MIGLDKVTTTVGLPKGESALPSPLMMVQLFWKGAWVQCWLYKVLVRADLVMKSSEKVRLLIFSHNQLWLALWLPQSTLARGHSSSTFAAHRALWCSLVILCYNRVVNRNPCKCMRKKLNENVQETLANVRERENVQENLANVREESTKLYKKLGPRAGCTGAPCVSQVICGRTIILSKKVMRMRVSTTFSNQSTCGAIIVQNTKHNQLTRNTAWVSGFLCQI